MRFIQTWIGETQLECGSLLLFELTSCEKIEPKAIKHKKSRQFLLQAHLP